MEQTNRIEWIDVAKGLGMLSVILGHCVAFGGKVHNLIFAFHMPFFFLLSGLVYKDDQIFRIIKRRLKSLIVPYVLFCALGVFLALVFGPSISFNQFVKDLYLGNPENIWVSSVWFLMALFITTVLFSCVLKIENAGFQYLIIIILLVIGIVFGKCYNAGIITHRLPLDIDVVMVSLFFFAVGYYGRNRFNIFWKYIQDKTKEKIILVCVASIVYAALSLLNHRVNLHAIEYGNSIIFIVAAILGSVILMVFSQMLNTGFIAFYTIKPAAKLGTMIKRGIIWIGRNNIYILGAQAIGVRVFIRMFNTATDQEYVLYSLPYNYALLSFLFTVLFSIVFTWIMKKFLNIILEKFV